jgi:hypothetical protein
VEAEHFAVKADLFVAVAVAFGHDAKFDAKKA